MFPVLDRVQVARDCVAQAWGVAEILRCWTHLEALRLANLGTA
jgi:hypothetical protein